MILASPSRPTLASRSSSFSLGCVAGTDGPITSSSATTATPTPAGTLTYSGTAAPTQSDIASSCKQYYLIQDGDTCYSIQDSFRTFTLKQFYSWNPSISTGCKGLEPGYSVYISDGSASSSTPASSTFAPTTTGGSSTATDHQPHQTGIPSNCNKWYWVVDGDDYQTIAGKFDMTKGQFYKWNPATEPTCKTLWQKAYVCIGVSGSPCSSSTKPTSTTSKTSAPSTTTATSTTEVGGVSV